MTADQVLVVVNKNAWHSIELGKYYMKKRGIPQENIIRLFVTDKERISREDYDKKIAKPIKRFIAEKEGQGSDIRCLVLMYGMPLKIAPRNLPNKRKRS